MDKNIIHKALKDLIVSLCAIKKTLAILIQKFCYTSHNIDIFIFFCKDNKNYAKSKIRLINEKFFGILFTKFF